jgi:hypothetical protein
MNTNGISVAIAGINAFAWPAEPARLQWPPVMQDPRLPTLTEHYGGGQQA